MNIASDLPARKVVSRSPVRTVRVLNLPGIFPSPVECESSLERDFVFRAALCPGVAHLRHQPFQLKLRSGKRYTPDFLVRHLDGSHTVIEVKLGQKIERYRATFDDAAEQLRERSFRFAVVDESGIRERKAHERAARVLRYRKAAVEPALRQRVLSSIAPCQEGVSIDALKERAGASREDLFHLIAARHLRSSRLLPLDGSALLFPFQSPEICHEHRIENWIGAAEWPAHA